MHRRMTTCPRDLSMAAAAAMTPTGAGYQGDFGLTSWIDPAGIRIRSLVTSITTAGSPDYTELTKVRK